MNSYLTPSRLRVLADGLSDRERYVLATICKLRLATGAQLERLHFPDVTPRERRRTLAGLVDKGLLHQLPRAIGGVRAGSRGHLYAPGIAAQRLNRTGGRAQRPWLPGSRFLAHGLAVSEAFVTLVESQRRGELSILVFESEPSCWRGYAAPGGARLVLRPDAYLQLQINAHVDHWFAEIDLGTESTRTLEAKCDCYRAYWATGREQDDHGAFPRVIFAVADAARLGVLEAVLDHQPEEARPLFTVCLASDLIERLRAGADR